MTYHFDMEEASAEAAEMVNRWLNAGAPPEAVAAMVLSMSVNIFRICNGSHEAIMRTFSTAMTMATQDSKARSHH